MNDEVDTTLRDRLAAIAAAVPVKAPGSTTVVRPRIRSGSLGRRVATTGLVPVLAIGVIGTVIAGLAKVGPFASSATPDGNGPVVATATNGPFELTLRSAKGRYTPDEPIEIEAALAYRGPESSIQIGHGIGARSSPVGFGVDEPVLGDLTLGPSWEAMCVHSTLAPSAGITVPFRKSAGWPGDDPRSLEYRDYVLSPDLRLAEGTWHPYVIAEFSVGDCTTDIIRLRVDIEIQVLEPEPITTEEPQATSAGEAATVRDGDFELTIRSDKTTYRPNEPIEVIGSLVYNGPADRVEIAHDSSGMILFGSRERIYGSINLSTATRLMCTRSTLQRNVPVDMPFRKGGGFPGDHPNVDFFRAFMLDPVFRLPAGTWHLYAVSSGGCMAGLGNPQFELEAEIAVEVSGEPVVIPPSAAPPAAPTPEIAPDDSPGDIQPDGSVLDVVDDGTFELHLGAAGQVYLQNQ